MLLADDHPSLLDAVFALLHPHFDVVGIAKDGEALVSKALRLKPDVVVVDIAMPVLSGLAAVHRLHESSFSARLVCLTMHPEEEFVKACMEEGASGYVLKSSMKAHLIPAIHAALAGRTYISPTVG